MTDREKLIELLKENCHFGQHCQKDCNSCMADHLIANGVTVQKWIPVSERLPEDMQERVLVQTDYDSPVGNQKIDTDRFRNSEWVRYGSHVTHWMPLPKGPKEDKT